MKKKNNRTLIGALTITLFCSATLMASVSKFERNDQGFNNSSEPKTSLIQIAILLDTSGSMKGLVDQARIQIWNVIDELAASTKNESESELEIAVFQYGSDKVSKSNGYIKRVLDFSGDLDEVSRALFSLEVRGGVELCGESIRQACDDLNWNQDAGYRAIFIAGNEAFDQGQTSFASVLPRLNEKSIAVNTIYCRWNKAKPNEDSLWKISAELASGSYAMIDHNKKMTDLKTPYDSQFRELNRRMNESFIWYGENASKHMTNQIEQDKNAKKMSNSAFASRMSSKIGHLYKHVHSDLVDAVQHGQLTLETMSTELMPENLRKMTSEQRMEFLKRKIADRESVRREMATLIAKREAWIRNNSSSSEPASETWGDALRTAVRIQLQKSGFEVRDDT